MAGWLALGGRSGADREQMNGYELWVVQCGQVPKFPRGAIHAMAPDSGSVTLPYAYVLARGEGHVIAIDTGFDGNGSGAAFAAARGVVGWQPPDRLLREIGLRPTDVDLVILTHAHWDHAGGAGFFPSASLVMQRREMSEWLRLVDGPPRHRLLREAVDPEDLARLRVAAAAGRLHLVDGAVSDLVPGISLIPAHDTHTPGSQCVAVTARDGSTWVAAGDCVMSYANIDGSLDGAYSPIGAVHGSRERLFDLYDRILCATGSADRVIPVHDADVVTRFGSVVGDGGAVISSLTGGMLAPNA